MAEKRPWVTPTLTTYDADELPASYADAARIIHEQVQKLDAFKAKKPWTKPTFEVRNLKDTEGWLYGHGNDGDEGYS